MKVDVSTGKMLWKPLFNHKKIIMKDYSKQIMAILMSSFNSDDLRSTGWNQISELSGALKAVEAINTFIQNEVNGLELQVVDLTEQLTETNMLLLETKRVVIPRISHKQTSRRRTRMTQANEIRDKNTNK